MRRAALGDQEMALLRYVTDRGPLTVGEAFEGYGGPGGLTRSTVVTVMDRLRAKGFLSRYKGADEVFRYEAVQPQSEVLGGVVTRFIESTLGGNLTALTAYFTRSERLSAAEKAELQRLLEKMEGGGNASDNH